MLNLLKVKFSNYILLSILLLIVFDNKVLCQNTIITDGYNSFYYDNGNLSSEGMMKSGKPDGYWKTYYENGIIKSEGNRKLFELDSIWKFYGKDGIIAMEISYMEGLKLGIKRRYGINEVILSEEVYANDKKNGLCKYYYLNGNIEKEIIYENDFKQGKSVIYSEDGVVNVIIKYENDFIVEQEFINKRDKRGLKIGVWKIFHEKGTVKIEGKYINGKREGFFREFSNDGKLLNTYKYENGELVENVIEFTDIQVEKEYYPGAIVKSEMTLVNGIPNGVFREYSLAGKVTHSKIYRNGKISGEGIVDKKGLKQNEWKEYYILKMSNDSILLKKAKGIYENGEKSGLWIFYHENGKIEQKGFYKNGKPVDKWLWYYDSGNILKEESYLKGVENGLIIEYSDSGNVIVSGQYIMGIKEGIWIYEMGDQKETGNYVDGKKNGIWQHLYKNGNVNFEGEFVDGEPNGKHKYFYESGKIKEEGSYVMGVKQGSWKKYDKDGVLIVVVAYEGGEEIKINGIKIETDSK